MGKESMAMEVATGQGRGLMMNMFMMWMAGNSLHIFPIMMVGMAIWSPVSAFMNMKQAFAKFEGDKANLLTARHHMCSPFPLFPLSPPHWMLCGQDYLLRHQHVW